MTEIEKYLIMSTLFIGAILYRFYFLKEIEKRRRLFGKVLGFKIIKTESYGEGEPFRYIVKINVLNNKTNKNEFITTDLIDEKDFVKLKKKLEFLKEESIPIEFVLKEIHRKHFYEKNFKYYQTSEFYLINNY